MSYHKDNVAYIGTVMMWPSDNVPPGWMLCDGRTLQVSQHRGLFMVLGNQYGGDGVTTFALPDLRGQVIVGAGAVHALGSQGGQAAVDVTLDASQLPAHTHTATLSGTIGTPHLMASSNVTGNSYVPTTTYKYMAGSPAGSVGSQSWASSLTSPVEVGGYSGGEVSGATVTIDNNVTQGASVHIPTQPPYVALNFIIAADGIMIWITP
ncbi:MAG: tail fiber protein [Thiotrichaceae bacterium]|nr:tail fiber protein [Thiotrichaceae bacterium]